MSLVAKREVLCPCGAVKIVSARNTERKYCSFPCYVKYTKGYDHKALGYRHDEETRMLMSEIVKKRPLSDVQKVAYASGWDRLSEAQRMTRTEILKKAQLRRESPLREETKQRISASRIGKGYGGAQNYRGGSTGDAFAAVLCPVGYIREFVWQWGPLGTDRFHLDFGHPEAKTCFELDGPGHCHTPQEDAERDEILKHFGWRVIRIRHD